MYLGECGCHAPDDQLAGFGSFLKKLTKPVTNVLKKVAAPALKLQKKVDDKLIATFVPHSLEPLAERIAKSTQRVNELLLVPTNAPAILKAEVKQMKDSAKDPEFMKLVGTIMAVVAIVYPFLQPLAAAMSALRVAAEITAAKKLNAQNAAEDAAAQAEFDAYAAKLAAAVQEGERLKATQQATAAQVAPGSQPVTLTRENQAVVDSLTPGFFAPGGEGSTESPMPQWVWPAVGVAALSAIVIARKRRRT